MGNTGAYLTYGILVLVLMPIVFSYIGQTFGETVDNQEAFNNQAPFNTGSFTATLGAYLQELEDVPIVGGVFGFLSNMFVGFSIVPAWVSLVIITLPTILIVRGVASTSG